MTASDIGTLPRTTADTGRGRAARALLLAASLLVSITTLAANAAAQAPQVSGADTFATVGDAVITVEEYVVTLRTAIREAYYHGQVPAAEMARFQRRVADELVDHLLLVREADRRGLRADPARYADRLASIATRYAGNAEFEANRETLLASLEQRLADNDRIAQLSADVRAVPPPEEAALRAYYEANLDKFTEPERIRVSAILLKVDPSAPRASWDAAREEATRLHQRLAAGADFAEMARLHSVDDSAAAGGDMGYLHRGMLGEPAQAALDTLQPGQRTPPVDLLEGIALFQLEDRQEALPNRFEAVRGRAAELLQRERAEQAWQGFIRELRSRTTVSIRQDLFLPESADAASVHGAAATPSPDGTQ